MNKRKLIRVSLAITVAAALAACAERAAPEEAVVAAPPPAVMEPQAAAGVPDLSDEAFWVRNADGRVLVTPDNFIRAESNLYMAGQAKVGAFGQFQHTRVPAPIDSQNIIRLNRDTVYSSAVFDLDAGPVELTLPDAGERFLSAMLINEDHFNREVYYEPGTYTLTRDGVGTRYVMVGVRILADPDDPEDMRQANALQDAITVSQPGGPGRLEVPEWDMASQEQVRNALLALSSTLPDLRYAAGPGPASVDPVRRLIAAASGWGLNPDKDAIYLNVFPERNDGKAVYLLDVADVPVDAFWSVSVYNREGYFEKNDLDAYVVNSVTGEKSADGSISIQFGDCTAGTPNCLPISDGWNYMVRLYRPRSELLDGTWSFPDARAR
ncbi:DUF1254 domain-containing protein [Luteimonas sp. A534]